MNYPREWIGHEKILKMLKTALAQGRLSHGYIFDGIEGIGKGSMAVWIAAHLFCTGQDKPCGTCPNCVRLATDNHPDILVLKPEDGSIKNHQVEAFQEFLMVKPFLGSSKIAIIEDADTMTGSAQNRLLKTLEEPASGVVLFLITTQFNRMLPTILSRCQVVRFQSLEADGIASYLVNQYNVGRAQAQQIAIFAAGSLKRAVEEVAGEGSSDVHSLVEGWLNALSRNDSGGMFALADKYEKAMDWNKALVWLIHVLRERISDYSSEGNIDGMVKAATMGRHAEDALRAMREQANERIVIDVMLLKIQEDYYD